MYFAREILISIAFAITLAFQLVPLVARLQRHHISRIVSEITTVLVLIAITGGLSWVVAGRGRRYSVPSILPEHQRQN